MQLQSLSAEPDPRGGGVLLSWLNPVAPGFGGVRVLRREGQYPKLPDDLGTSRQIFEDLLTPAGAPGRFLDSGLKGETVYYYAVATLDAAGDVDPSFTSSLTLSPYRTADQLYAALPEIFQLYDTVKPPPSVGVAAADLDQGQLRRFVDLLASPFDLLRSSAAAMRDFHDIERVDGALLPLLGQWLGHSTNTTLDLPHQRNEIRFAPHYARTVGIPANLRAAVNRLTNWDVQLKEFVHNVFLSNNPAGLALRQIKKTAGVFGAPAALNFDLAYQGRPSAFNANDGRVWLFYQASMTPPRARNSPELRPSDDRFHLFCKIEDSGRDLPRLRITGGPYRYSHPSAVQRVGGNVWLFSAAADPRDETQAGSRLAMHVLSAGGPALPAELHGAASEPFALVDGDTLRLAVGGSSNQRVVTARAEHFFDITRARAWEIAALLERELPGVNVAASDDGRILVTTLADGAGASIAAPGSPLASKLGLPAAAVGRPALLARVTSERGEPFALTEGDELWVKVDADDARQVVFHPEAFANMASATALELVAVVEKTLPGVATASAGRLVLSSLAAGASSVVVIDVVASSAAPKLGLGAAPPAAGPFDTTPSAFADGTGGLWLFWASRRDRVSNLWYSRFDGSAWASPKRLTRGFLADRNPSGAFDPSGPGRLWLFWSRKLLDGRTSMFARTTTQLDFGSLTDADWHEEEISAAAGYDNDEPSAVVQGAAVELVFSSNRVNGWNLWTKTIGPGPPLVQGPDEAVTEGLETKRGATLLAGAGGDLRLWFRTNATRTFESASYPSTHTLDDRGSGSTTADTMNPAKLSLRRSLGDIQRYSYDTGRADENLYARDTVGAYLTADAGDQVLLLRQQQLVTSIIREFLPIQVRVVFLIESAVREFVYDYDNPGVTSPIVIGEASFESILPEVARPAADTFVDRMNVKWLSTFIAGDPTAALPDLSVHPPDLSRRLFSKAFDEEP